MPEEEFEELLDEKESRLRAADNHIVTSDKAEARFALLPARPEDAKREVGSGSARRRVAFRQHFAGGRMLDWRFRRFAAKR